MSDTPLPRPVLELLQGGKIDTPVPPTSIQVPPFPAPRVPPQTVAEIRAGETPRERRRRQDCLRIEDNIRALRIAGIPAPRGTT